MVIWNISAGLVTCACMPVLAQQSSPHEETLDRFARVFEDLAAALVSIENKVEADMVASRVAVDFLGLAELNPIVMGLKDNKPSPSFSQSFALRSQEAGRTVGVAMERLRSHACYNSRALVAAMALGGLLDKKLTREQAAECAAELMVNNQECLVRLLQETRDADSADKVAFLIRANRDSGDILEKFAMQYRDVSMDRARQSERSARAEMAASAMMSTLDALQKKNYYDSVRLKELFDVSLPMPHTELHSNSSHAPQ